MHRQRGGLSGQAARVLDALARSGDGPWERGRIGLLTEFDRRQLDRLLGQLVERGWLTRIRRGLYDLVRADGTTRSGPLSAALALVRPAVLSHGSALDLHELSDVPSRGVVVTTTSRTSRRRRTVEGRPVRIVLARPSHFFGFLAVPSPVGEHRVTDLERTFLDVLDRPELAGGFVSAAAAMCGGRGDLDLSRLASYAARLENGALLRRAGWLLQRWGSLPRAVQHRWASTDGRGIARLDARGPDVGEPDPTWRVLVNVSIATTTGGKP